MIRIRLRDAAGGGVAVAAQVAIPEENANAEEECRSQSDGAIHHRDARLCAYDRVVENTLCNDDIACVARRDADG